MVRRCTSESCKLNAARAANIRLDLPVVNILHNPKREWTRLGRGGFRIASERSLNVDWNEYNSEDYLFTQCAIVSSVETEDNGYYIKPPCDELVNSNGNAWSTPVLLATFKSFVGKPNYLEHVQIPALSKGILLDAVARPVKYIGKDGKSESDVYYIDILVATHRKHAGIIDRIESGELNAMSMGCLANQVQCSRCGIILSDDQKNCKHLDNQMLEYFTDENGVNRIVAELCGSSYIDQTTGERVGDPNSVEFIEASWVEEPAFRGAVISHFILDEQSEKRRMEKSASDKMLQLAVDDLFKLKVADNSGMLVIKVAQQFLREQQKQAMIDRIANFYIK